MNRPRSRKSLLGGVLLLSVLLSAPLPAQTIDVLWTNSLTAMNAGEWSKAHALLSKAVAQYDKRAPMLFGPKFGWFWYHKGYCELKVKEYEMAMKSFEACYKKYPNGASGPDKAGDAKNISFNLYHKRSLLKWGEAAQGAEDYQLAIRMYRKFLDERDKKAGQDPYEKGAFYVNMAVCYFKLFKIPEGIENLETAIKNKEVFPTPDQGIMAGFQSLVQACIEKTNEQALMDFLDKNRADITLEPFQMCSFGPIFMRLAADALSADMDRTAFELYALVPSTVAAVGDVEARIASLATLPRQVKDGSKVLDKKLLTADLEILKGYKKSGHPPEVTALEATAFIHEQNGNARGAFAAYEQLELFFNKAPKREEYLYNLVRTSSLIGEVLTTEKYGSIFLKTFPESDHVESVRNMMLTSLFYEGEYVKCIEVASVMIDKLATPSKQHDICLHVLGGSYYYTGAYDTAQPLLEQHVEEYPESDFKMAAMYFVGSNLSRLQFWTKAATLLDKFLTKYPDPRKNIYMPFALYDRANCHYAADKEMPQALEKLNKLESTFPGSEIMDMAFNLKGNVLQSTDEIEEAEVYYLKALELAERRQNRLVAGEALYYLVGLIGVEKRGKKENPRAKEAVPYYDKFWKQYGVDSPYKAQVAVAGVHSMTISGRAEEALERLQGVISELAQIQGAVGLEEAINSYTKAYLNEHSPVELKDHYYKFPGIDADNRAAQALLRIAIIGVYEGKVQTAKKEKNEDDERNAKATIMVLFRDLKNDFQPKSLSNYILVRVGDYLREGTSAARQAVPYYEEAISREDQSYRFPALFGLADIYGDSDNRNENDKAIESLKRIYADAQEKKQKEKALYRIITILAKKEEWSKVSERAKEYLDREKGYRSFSAQVSFLLAKSYDERAMSEDALKAYMNVWAAYAGYMEISIPSVRRVMELTWKRDGPAAPPKKADRQIGYEFGWKFVESVKLGNAYKMMKPEERNSFEELEALVQQYEDDPAIMKMSEVKKREREGRR
jgi:tetratricopeptide (TPR) repeat protein